MLLTIPKGPKADTHTQETPVERIIREQIPDAKEKLASMLPPIAKPMTLSLSIPPAVAATPQLVEGIVDQKGNPIQLDSYQEAGVAQWRKGSSFSILGKAGSGKTTMVQAIALDYIHTHDMLSSANLTNYRIRGLGDMVTAPAMAVVAFTNRATNNIRNKLCSHPEVAKCFGYNVTTVHNLLEYSVEFITDPETGDTKRIYYPKRDRYNKLNITHLIVEEGTLLGVGDNSLWQQLWEALPPGVQIIFLGDLNQLPPVIGKSVLNYAVQQLPIIELKHVHRQALESGIIRQALRVIEGRPVKEDYDPATQEGIRLFTAKAKTYKMGDVEFRLQLRKFFEKLIKAGQFNPMEDMILSPWNVPNAKAITAQGISTMIATYMAHTTGSTVYEIIAGFRKIYLRVGDRVFLDKQEGIVTEIRYNYGYYGKTPSPESKNLDYTGSYVNLYSDHAEKNGTETNPFADEEYDFSHFNLEAASEDVETDERKRASSHIVTVRIDDTEQEMTLQAAGHFNDFMLGYALSVHKAQGSEWPRVVLVLHDTNNTHLFRELFYTAMTRPRLRLDVVAQQHIIDKCQKNQRIKGSTLADKIEFFNSGYLDQVVDIIPAEEGEEE